MKAKEQMVKIANNTTKEAQTQEMMMISVFVKTTVSMVSSSTVAAVGSTNDSYISQFSTTDSYLNSSQLTAIPFFYN